MQPLAIEKGGTAMSMPCYCAASHREGESSRVHVVSVLPAIHSHRACVPATELAGVSPVPCSLEGRQMGSCSRWRRGGRGSDKREGRWLRSTDREARRVLAQPE